MQCLGYVENSNLKYTNSIDVVIKEQWKKSMWKYA